MNIQIGDVTLSIRWEHKRFIKDKNGNVTRIEATKRWTKCIISLGSGKDSEVIATGITNFRKDELFCKCRGRKLSLGDALLLLNENHNDFPSVILTKEQRKDIWIEFSTKINCDFEISTKLPIKRKITVINDTAAEFCERLDG